MATQKCAMPQARHNLNFALLIVLLPVENILMEHSKILVPGWGFCNTHEQPTVFVSVVMSHQQILSKDMMLVDNVPDFQGDISERPDGLVGQPKF